MFLLELKLVAWLSAIKVLHERFYQHEHGNSIITNITKNNLRQLHKKMQNNIAEKQIPSSQ
jgi:hypothetical protein